MALKEPTAPNNTTIQKNPQRFPVPLQVSFSAGRAALPRRALYTQPHADLTQLALG